MHATTRVRDRFLGLSLALLIPLAAGCGGDRVTGPDTSALDEVALGVTGAAIDLNGSWDWSETTVIKMKAFAVPLFFGVPAEGPITHITCRAWGTLDIAQVGSTFTGTSTQAGSCVTKKGQPVAAPFPPTLTLIDGQITGRSYRFTFDAGPFPLGGQILCHNRGAIRVTGGVAVELHGGGDCLLPNEKTFGHDFTRHFRADRI